MSDVIVTVGLDLAKNVFQVHGIDADGRVGVRRKLRRAEVTSFFAGLLSPCLVGMEACASSHFWAREIARLGHEVIVAAQGVEGLSSLKTHFQKVLGSLPEHATAALQTLIRMADCLVDEIERLESRILDWHRANDASRRLATIPGIGPITASAIAANVPDASLFRTARQFAAWLGLTPRANSSGGKERQMGISKQGDGYIRRLLVSGASAVMRFARQGDPGKAWLVGVKERKRPKVAAVAQANKTARIAWAILRRNEVFAARTA